MADGGSVRATFAVELDADLRDRFLAAAAAADRPAAEIVAELLAQFVDGSSAHDAWMRGEIEAAVRASEAPGVVLIPNEQATAEWRARRAVMLRDERPPTG